MSSIGFQIGVSNPGPGGGDSKVDPEITRIELEYPRPLLTRIEPDQAIAGNDVLLTLRGNNFYPTSVISVNGIEHRADTVTRQTMSLRVLESELEVGENAVFVTNPSSEGRISDPLILTVVEQRNDPPLVSAVSPSEIEAGSADVFVTITGSGFMETTSVHLDGSAIQSTTDNTIELKLSASVLDSPGQLNGVVSNPVPGGGVAPFAIRVTGVPPVITGFTPEGAAVTSSALELIVFGLNFEERTAITVEGTRIPTSFVSSSELTGTMNRGILKRAGQLRIGVITPPSGGSDEAGQLFAIESTRPSISGVDPSVIAPTVGRVTISILGAGFVGNSEALVDGVPVKTLFDTPEALTAILDREILSLPGEHFVQVSNPEGGGLSPETVSFVVESPVPIVRSLNPNTIEAGVFGLRVTVRGEGFTEQSVVVVSGSFESPPGIAVDILGEFPVPTVFSDEKTLEFELPFGATAGLAIGVLVENPAATRSNVQTLAVGPPKGSEKGSSNNSGNNNSGQGGGEGSSGSGGGEGSSGSGSSARSEKSVKSQKSAKGSEKGSSNNSGNNNSGQGGGEGSSGSAGGEGSSGSGSGEGSSGSGSGEGSSGSGSGEGSSGSAGSAKSDKSAKADRQEGFIPPQFEEGKGKSGGGSNKSTKSAKSEKSSKGPGKNSLKSSSKGGGKG